VVVYPDPMRILIVGATPLTLRLQSVFDDYWDNHQCVLVDSPDLRAFNEFAPHIVVNGGYWETDSPKAFVNNSRDPATCALYARMVDASYFHLSDSSVFSMNRPSDTDDPYPTRIYGLSRLLGERAVRALHPKAAIVRTSWLYGPDLPESPPMIAHSAAIGERSRAHVYDDVLLNPTYVGDAAGTLAINIVASSVTKDIGGTYHLSPERTCSWFAFLRDDYDVLPVKLKGYGPDGARRVKDLSVEPSPGWTINDGGLNRFKLELETGRWDWTGGFSIGNTASGAR